MYGLAAGLGISPFAQFLGQTAVVGMGAVAIGQILSVHQLFHADVHGIQVRIPAREEFRQATAFLWSFRMQGEMYPLRLNIEIPL